MIKVLGVIQARINSTRLPNKVMLHFNGFPIIEWVVTRSKKSRLIDKLVVAIPSTKNNDLLENFIKKKLNVDVFRGSEKDLIKRYLDTAKLYNAQNIVRICSDNPLICPNEIDRLVSSFDHKKFDYAYNHIPRENNYPDGLGAEICTFSILKHLNEKAKGDKYREHIFNFVWERRKQYRINIFDAPLSISFPKLKLDINTIEDYQKLLSIPFKIDMNSEEIVKLALDYE